MVPAPFRVILDANILYPLTLRDTLLRAAEQDLFLPGWSEEILKEAHRNLVENRQMSPEQGARLIEQMKMAFPEAMIGQYQHLTPAMRCDDKDRHVAAAAVHAGAQLIVTENLRDFRNLPDGLEVKSAGAFLLDLYDLDPDGMTGILMNQAASLRQPPRTVDDILRVLRKQAPEFVENIRRSIECRRA